MCYITNNLAIDMVSYDSGRQFMDDHSILQICLIHWMDIGGEGQLGSTTIHICPVTPDDNVTLISSSQVGRATVDMANIQTAVVPWQVEPSTEQHLSQLTVTRR